jgi:Uma2 family endonuclease
MNAPAYLKLTKADFYEFLRSQSEGRFEFVRGRIVQQMPGGTRRHSVIAKRFDAVLERQLDRDKWLVISQGRGLETDETVRFPDVVVEPIAGADDESLATTLPAIAVEVLSKTSEKRDFHEKPDEYMSLASLHAYIIASQTEPRCWVWSRGAHGDFPERPVEIAGLDGLIEIAALGLRIPLAEIYR